MEHVQRPLHPRVRDSEIRRRLRIPERLRPPRPSRSRARRSRNCSSSFRRSAIGAGSRKISSALLRLRGMESNSPSRYAEGFYGRKVVSDRRPSNRSTADARASPLERADPDVRGCAPPAQVTARLPGYPPEIEVLIVNNDPRRTSGAIADHRGRPQNSDHRDGLRSGLRARHQPGDP